MIRGFVALLVILTLAGCMDHVTVNGGDGAEVGMLVDGAASGATHNDDRVTGAAATAINVGPFDASAGEVIGYTSGHAPTILTPVAWTSGNDDVSVAMDPKYKVKFRIWVLKAPFADGQTKAVNACIRTSQIWSDERQGTGFSQFEITDATGDPDAATFTAFTCGGATSNDISTKIGFDTNAVNVYWVDTVDFGSGAATSNGVWCGGNILAMGWNTSDHLFSHEIGHAFTLGHVNGLTTNFDTTNVMHNASNDRRWLTEGQTLRAVYTSGAATNTIGTRSGQPTRDCPSLSESVSDAQCPAIQKRIWADSATWPPN